MIAALALTVVCDAAVPRADLLSLLDLELAHTTATVDIRIDATPCTPTSPLTITIDDAAPLTIELPPLARARTLALLLSDLIRHPAAVAPPPPSAPASPSASVPSSPSPPPAFPPPASPPPASPPPASPRRLQLGLSYLRRTHPRPAASGDGLRLSLPYRAPSLPWLAVAVDTSLDELTSTTAVRVDSLRAGLLVGPRLALPYGLTTYAALRAELSRSWAETTMDTMPVTLRHGWTTSAGALFGGELALTSSIGLRLEIELGRTLSTVDVVRSYTDPTNPPPDQLDVVAGDFRTVALGVFVR